MQLKLKHNKCIAIGQSNNTPICQNCIEKTVEDWLKIRKPRLIPTLRRKAHSFFANTRYTNHVVCAFCNKKINACDFCFINYIKEWIEDKYPGLVTEFRLFFDFR